MGYRSEVGIALKKSDYEKLICAAKEDKSNGTYDLLKWADKIVDFGDKVSIHFCWVKWYKTFDGVKFIMEFLHTQADGYGYVELGEENTDITEDYCDGEDGTTFYEEVASVREIFIPIGEEIKLA